MIVLDTHVWLWWISSPEKLSEAAAQCIDYEAKSGHIYISSMSAWEVAMLVARGRLELSIDVSDWLAVSESFPFIKFIPVDNRIALQSVRLPGVMHNDPADRIIVATALVMNASVVSADRKIIDYPAIKCIW